MNENDQSRRRRRAETSGPEDSGDGAPFRRLRSGRRRFEPTAPLDAEKHPGAELADDDYAAPAGDDAAEQALEAQPANFANEPEAAKRPHPVHDPDSENEPTPVVEPAVVAAVPVADDQRLQEALAARKKRRRRRNAVMLAVFAVFVLAATSVGLFVNNLLDAEPEDFEGPGEGNVTFVVEAGWGPNRIGAELVADGVVASQDAFLEALGASDADNTEIHPGEYELQQKIPATEAVEGLLGQASSPVSYVAIQANARLGNVLSDISDATGINLTELEELADQPEAFGLSAELENLEGFLHPGEYRFDLEAEPQEILQTLVDATNETLEAEGLTDPEDAYRALKIASIVQAESRQGDYATVAGAIENRLDPGNQETSGYLQVDSAVVYGLDRYSLEFTAEEKADESNAYNTYAHSGLPPTPIGSPGKSAIAAAAQPDENDYYYWVTVNIATGETKFADNYAEHQQNQQEYRDYCAANPDVCGS